MRWESWSQFWDMGGYGLYVWGSYAVTALLMGVEVWMAVHRHRQARLNAHISLDEENSQ